ncbi:MAG: hypothetical protein HOV81_31390 [Kofleriaceae bacterium]|nr:hypothetical protein [Kofleriaceae bacterium]
MSTRIALFALAAALVACGKGDDKKKAEPAPTTGSAEVKAPAAPAGVGVYVDGKQVATVTDAQISAWPRLDSLVPAENQRLGTWDSINLTSEGGKATAIAKPSASHPDLVPALYPGEGGAPAFGLFDPVELAKHGKPSLGETKLQAVSIKLSMASGHGGNDHQGGDIQDPTKLELIIKTPKGEQTVTGAKLLEVQRVPAPGEEEAKGWPLAVILDHAGVKGYQKLLLTDGKETALTLEKGDLDEKVSVPYVKLNRQGALRVTVYKKHGESWQRGGDLRGLVYIEVQK